MELTSGRNDIDVADPKDLNKRIQRLLTYVNMDLYNTEKHPESDQSFDEWLEADEKVGRLWYFGSYIVRDDILWIAVEDHSSFHYSGWIGEPQTWGVDGPLQDSDYAPNCETLQELAEIWDEED